MRARVPVYAGVVLVLSSLSSALKAQAVPEGSQSMRVDRSYRRTPSLRLDPFRHIMMSHFGIVFSGGALAENNSFNLDDIGAIIKLTDDDSLTLGDAFDALGLIPSGAGWTGLAQGEGGISLGGPLTSRLGIGLSAQVRGYGVFEFDDDAVAIFRDGTTSRTEFTLGSSRAASLITAEFGAHAVVHLNPIGSADGARLTLGGGARILRPLVYGMARSTIQNGGRISITDSLIAARIGVESLYQIIPDNLSFSGYLDRGSGLAADFLVRVEWPTNGIAFEIMAANIGSVDVKNVELRDANINVSEPTLERVIDILTFSDPITLQDTLSFDVRDTLAVVNVDLPKLFRFTVSAWANRILQIDLAATAPVTGEFDTPAVVDLGTTWRFIRLIPLRIGIVLGGPQGVGYTGGIGIEGRRLYLQAAAGSLGGAFRGATGTAGRFEFGIFF